MSNATTKAVPAAVALAIWLVSPCCAQETGRYQLFQGTYQFVNLKGEGFQTSSLFKIDSATGKTWVARSNQFCVKPNDCKQSTGWTEFETEVKIKPSGQ